jgi:hypothetical protein
MYGNEGQKRRKSIQHRAVVDEGTKMMDRYPVETQGKPLQSLSDIRPLYFLPHDPLAAEVLIPGFNQDCRDERRVVLSKGVDIRSRDAWDGNARLKQFHLCRYEEKP